MPANPVVFDDASGTAVEDAVSLDPGQSLSIGYGETCAEGARSAVLEVQTDPSRPASEGVEGCSRIAPLRGGPPQPSAAVVVFTADLAVTIHGAAEDLEDAKVAADALRQVGQARQPAWRCRPVRSRHSGRRSGLRAETGRPGNDHGRGPVDEADAMKVPDFTLQRLGGGRLRWSDHAGPPVVLIAGTLHRSLREYHGLRAHI